MSAAVKVMLGILKETSLHVSYCAEFGITLEELEATPESPATTAYGAFLVDVGLQGSVLYQTPSLSSRTQRLLLSSRRYSKAVNGSRCMSGWVR